jgi:hypothetical protein
VFCDGGFKRAFVAHCGGAHISAEVVSKIHQGRFEVLPRRWVVERTWVSVQRVSARSAR